MRFAYEDLSPEQFEGLVVLLCQQLFGLAIQGFTQGVDGGRDAKFMGRAEQFPSKAAPWEGTTIVQAKHTNGYNRSFSESDFYSESSSNTIIAKEVQRIKKLREAAGLDHYILFSNRRLTAQANEKIQEHIATQCTLLKGDVYLCDVEQLERWLKYFPQVEKDAKLDPVDSPLIVSPETLAQLIEVLADQKETIRIPYGKSLTDRISYQKKNELNNMSSEYADSIRKKYLKESEQIRHFLAAPENAELLIAYECMADEFQLKITSHRKSYQEFNAVMEYLVDLLFNRDPVLRANKRLTRAFLFYMYWNCDIGAKQR